MKLRLLLLAMVIPSLAFSQKKVPVANDTPFVSHALVNEPMPEFPGGVKALNAYIRKNTKQPTGLDCTQGTVYISFMVNEDGAVTEAKVLKSLNDPCNRNALEIISNMPKWKPAVLDGKKQKTRMVLPVKFGS